MWSLCFDTILALRATFFCCCGADFADMWAGASDADVAVLVVDARVGEFETGFHKGGQTREHALVARSLGVAEIVVAVNKMDATGWAQARYDSIVQSLQKYLKTVGFKKGKVHFVYSWVMFCLCNVQRYHMKH